VARTWKSPIDGSVVFLLFAFMSEKRSCRTVPLLSFRYSCADGSTATDGYRAVHVCAGYSSHRGSELADQEYGVPLWVAGGCGG
jgi:hypothetical protein